MFIIFLGYLIDMVSNVVLPFTFVDIEGDQEALDTILHNKVLCERKVKGRTTLETMSMR
jgi:hypothetical protein